MTFTKEQLQQIEATAKEVLWPIVWTPLRARKHFEEKITPEVVFALARIALAGMVAVLDEAADHRDAFEAVFPIPLHAERCGAGYCCTAYNAWDAHKFVNRWDGWNACRAAMLQGESDGNSPVIKDGWVACSERLPDETNDPDGGATCYLVLYAEGRQPNGGSNVQVSNVTYLRRWHDGMITHWMPLPAAPQQVE